MRKPNTTKPNTSKTVAKTKPKPTTDTTADKNATETKPVQNSLRVKQMSVLDAAAKVLAQHKEPVNCSQMIELITKAGYWKPTKGGKTPANTLYAAILREINSKGTDSRFEKVGRGQFALRLKN